MTERTDGCKDATVVYAVFSDSYDEKVLEGIHATMAGAERRMRSLLEMGHEGVGVEVWGLSE